MGRSRPLASIRGPDETNGITSYRLVENDSDLVHGLLEVEGALLGLGSSRTEKDYSRFSNDRVRLLLRPEPRNPWDMIQNGSCSIVDQRFLYEQYESERRGRSPRPATDRGGFIQSHSLGRIWLGAFFPFDCIERPNSLGFPYWARSFRGKQIISDEENDSEFLQSVTVQYQTRDRSSNEQDFFRISQFIWDPADPLFFLFKDQPFVSVFSLASRILCRRRDVKGLTSQTDPPICMYVYRKAGLSRICKKSTSDCWFITRDGLEPIVHYRMGFSVLILRRELSVFIKSVPI